MIERTILFRVALTRFQYDQIRRYLFFKNACPFVTPQMPLKQTRKSTPLVDPLETFSLGPCPADRAQNSVQGCLSEISVRPNPALVSSEFRFNCRPPPLPHQKKYTLGGPLETFTLWDHAQMTARKVLFRVALTRVLYDQARP